MNLSCLKVQTKPQVADLHKCMRFGCNAIWDTTFWHNLTLISCYSACCSNAEMPCRISMYTTVKNKLALFLNIRSVMSSMLTSREIVRERNAGCSKSCKEDVQGVPVHVVWFFTNTPCQTIREQVDCMWTVRTREMHHYVTPLLGCNCTRNCLIWFSLFMLVVGQKSQTRRQSVLDQRTLHDAYPACVESFCVHVSPILLSWHSPWYLLAQDYYGQNVVGRTTQALTVVHLESKQVCCKIGTCHNQLMLSYGILPSLQEWVAVEKCGWWHVFQPWKVWSLPTLYWFKLWAACHDRNALADVETTFHEHYLNRRPCSLDVKQSSWHTRPSNIYPSLCQPTLLTCVQSKSITNHKQFTVVWHTFSTFSVCCFSQKT